MYALESVPRQAVPGPRWSIIDVESSEGIALLVAMRRSKPCVLVGSAISLESGVPTGAALTTSIAELIARPVNDPKLTRTLLSSAAFEYLMESCPDKEAAADILTSVYGSLSPNRLHRMLAALIADGVLRSVITTNYDGGIEGAFSVCVSAKTPLHLLVVESHRAYRSVDRPTLFKVHGCAVIDSARNHSSPRTLVFHLQSEGELTPWKREALRELVGSAPLLVTGYSGRDFEICPELASLGVPIVWNSLYDPRDAEHPLSPSARSLLDSAGGTVLVGPMDRVLENLGAASEPPSRVAAPPSASFADDLERRLGQRKLELWRVRALSAIGSGDDAVRLGRLLNGSVGTVDIKYKAATAVARAFFQRGQYRTAARHYASAREVASSLGESDSALEARLEQVEAERCAGRFSRAWKHLSIAREEIGARDTWLAHVAALRECLLLRHQFQVAQFMRQEGRAQHLRNRAAQLLRGVATEAAKQGHWPELQQCELWATRFGIPLSDIFTGPLRPLASREGYRQFGYVIAESMAARDLVAAGDAMPPAQLQTLLDNLECLGASAELWKLVWMAVRRSDLRTVGRRHLISGIRAWLVCEYTLWLRLFLLFRS